MSFLKNDKKIRKHTNRRSVTEYIKTKLDFDHVLTILSMIFVIGFLTSVTIKTMASEDKNEPPKTFYMDVPLPAVKKVETVAEDKLTRLKRVAKQTGKIEDKADLYRFMKRSKIKFPELVWAQAMLESEWMRSPVYHRSNNLFGMKKSGSRENVQIHLKGDMYSHFKNTKYSVIDMILHQDHVLKVDELKTERQYLNRLVASGYIRGDDAYRGKILSIRNKTDFASMM